jgi:2,3-bisphosphoglycerate-dependent phosphoglycerate mutase
MTTTSNTSSLGSDKAESQSSQTGQVYFVRHGESTSNERNIFAGVLDVELTAFGRLQAQQAGNDIKKKGVQFDAVYVSHMRRARQTCKIALNVQPGIKVRGYPN